MNDTYEQRAARRRATWSAVIRPSERSMQADETTIEQRVFVMAELASAAWALSGRTLPEYTRATMPGRVIRADEVP